MSYLIPRGSPKAADASAFGRELVKAARARGVPFKELERVTGVGHTSLDNYRRGLNLPKTETAIVLAETLHWPKLRAIVIRSRTATCVRTGCERTFRNEGGSRKIYCSEICRRIAENVRIAQRRNRQAGQGANGKETPARRHAEAMARMRSGLAIAEDRARMLEQAIAAMCGECEPERICRTEECLLRPFSPLPLARHHIGYPRTETRIREQAWSPARRAAFSTALVVAHAEGRIPTHSWTTADREKGIESNRRRSGADLSRAATKGWETRRARRVEAA